MSAVQAAEDIGQNALDESDDAEAILRSAVAFAAGYNARLSLAHVLELPRSTMEIDVVPYRKELKDDAEFKLRELKGSLGLDVPHSVLDPSDMTISEALSQEAVRRQADLIITGRGRAQHTFDRVWSRLYALIRESPCPVLSI